MHDIQTVRCFVWGWDSPAMVLHSQILDGILQYANGALNCGLSENDIADDVFDTYGHIFEDVDAEVDGHELLIVCLPHGMPPSMIQPGATGQVGTA